MKAITGLLVAVAILGSSAAQAQYYPQAAVTGTVLSYGPRGFMLEGPDGNYGIEVAPSTVVTDTWGTLVGTGQGNVVPGDYVTATGNPTSQWTMLASRVVVRNLEPPAVYPPYGGYYGPSVVPGTEVIQTPPIIMPLQQGVNNLNTLPNVTLPASTVNLMNPFSIIRGRR